MAEVDVEDDSLQRHVVFHYRYDPARGQRRHVFIAAYDNARERDRHLNVLAADLRRRRRDDPDFDKRENVTGTVYEPGDRQRSANSRLVEGMVGHGVVDLELFGRLDLSESSFIMLFSTPDDGDPDSPADPS